MSAFPYPQPKTMEHVAANFRELDRILPFLFPRDSDKMFRIFWDVVAGAKALKIQTKGKKEDENAWSDWSP